MLRNLLESSIIDKPWTLEFIADKKYLSNVFCPTYQTQIIDFSADVVFGSA